MKIKISAAAVITAAVLMCQAVNGAAPEGEAPKPAADTTATVSGAKAKVSEAVGIVISEAVKGALKNVETLGVDIDRDLVCQALVRRVKGEELSMTPAEADAFISSYINVYDEVADTLSVASQQEFMARAGAEPGALTLPDGLVFIVLTEGEGAMPTERDSVVVKYTGRLSDGTVFDRTEADEEVTFPVAGLVKGFTEGLKMTRPGGTYRIVIPAALGYGEKGIRGAIPGNAALDFTVEVLAVRRE